MDAVGGGAVSGGVCSCSGGVCSCSSGVCFVVVVCSVIIVCSVIVCSVIVSSVIVSSTAVRSTLHIESCYETGIAESSCCWAGRGFGLCSTGIWIGDCASGMGIWIEACACGMGIGRDICVCGFGEWRSGGGRGGLEVFFDFGEDVVPDADEELSVWLGDGLEVFGFFGFGGEGSYVFCWIGFDGALHAGGNHCGKVVGDGGELGGVGHGFGVGLDIRFDFRKVRVYLGKV